METTSLEPKLLIMLQKGRRESFDEMLSQRGIDVNFIFGWEVIYPFH